jgi:hypothetical protein
MLLFVDNHSLGRDPGLSFIKLSRQQYLHKNHRDVSWEIISFLVDLEETLCLRTLVSTFLIQPELAILVTTNAWTLNN